MKEERVVISQKEFDEVIKQINQRVICQNIENLIIKNNNYNDIVLNNSSAKLYYNSSAKLYYNSSAELYDNSSAKANHNSVLILKYHKNYKYTGNDNTQIILQEKFIHTQETYRDMHESLNDKIILYKITNDNYFDYYTQKIKYEIGKETICPDFDKDGNRQCGGGLHLSPTISMAIKYNNPGRILKCLVDIKDFVIYQNDLTKVRCKKVFVLEEVNKKGEKIN